LIHRTGKAVNKQERKDMRIYIEKATFEEVSSFPRRRKRRQERSPLIHSRWSSFSQNNEKRMENEKKRDSFIVFVGVT
jgi:hypothetical protein